MALQSFDSIQQTSSSNNHETQVGFFQLKNDGDEAVVRFMHDTTASFEIFTTHTVVTPTGKYMKINCLREANDPVSKCPFCESKEVKMSQTFCARLIQYSKDENGNIVGSPKVWARPMMFAQKLKSYIDNYGPLSDVICKIIRHGAAGNKQTEYEVVPNLSKTVYRDDIYVKNESAFNGYTALGRVVVNKTADEMREFVATKSFPASNYSPRTDAPSAAGVVAKSGNSSFADDLKQFKVASATSDIVTPTVTETPAVTEAVKEVPVQQSTTTTANIPPVTRTFPWETASPAFSEKPKRG